MGFLKLYLPALLNLDKFHDILLTLRLYFGSFTRTDLVRFVGGLEFCLYGDVAWKIFWPVIHS